MNDIRASIQIKGNDSKETRRFIGEIISAIEAKMKLSQTEPKSGRVYRRGGRTHTASAPGEAPAVDTGFLINSIQSRIISDTEGEIAINTEYGEFLEFGTSRMAARPFVEPAIEGVIEGFNRSGGILQSLRE
jgi:HK97 gp10 family phage protein